jgi:hypothetical protein
MKMIANVKYSKLNELKILEEEEKSIKETKKIQLSGPTFVDEGQAAFKGLVDRAGDGKVVDQGFVVRHGPDLVIKEVEVAGAAATW